MKHLPFEEAQSSSLAPSAIRRTARTSTLAWRTVRALIIVPGATLVSVGYCAVSFGIIGRYGFAFGATFIASTALILLWARSFIDVIRTEVHERRYEKISAAIASR